MPDVDVDQIEIAHRVGSPSKLRDGNWGARVPGEAQPGDVVTITTRAGKSWDAVVTGVVWSGPDATLVKTAHLERGESADQAARRYLRMHPQPAVQPAATSTPTPATPSGTPAATAIAPASATGLRTLSAATAAPSDPVAVPGLPAGTLRGYQQSGVRYLIDAPRSIQADDMGLGKTLQTLAALRAADGYPALVVCPATLSLNWRDELDRWFPDVKSQVLKTGKTPLDPAVQVTICSYSIAKARADELAQRGFKALVCDEAHYLKSGKAQRTKAIQALAGFIPRVHLLTGTPVTNRPADLISLLKITGHLQKLGGWYTFATRYCAAERTRFGWDVSGHAHLDELADKLRSMCLVRRTKSEVLTELPSKTRVIQRVDVSLGKYREAERALLAAIGGQIAARKAAAAAHRAGQEPVAGGSEQAAVIVELNKALHEAGLAKAPAAIEAIQDYVDSDRKVVVFAHHRDVLDAIRAGLPDEVKSVRVDGEVAAEARAEAVKRFQTDPECKVFLATSKTAGVGLTLTAASDVLIAEQEWVPADLDQAEDRCHRIGQTSAVQAVHLIAAGTVDEKIVAVVQSKRAVAQAAMANGTTEAADKSRGSVFAEVLGQYESQARPARRATPKVAEPAAATADVQTSKPMPMPMPAPEPVRAVERDCGMEIG